MQYAMYYLAVRAHPGLGGGSVWMHLSHSFLGRSQSSSGDRYANRSFKNNIASDLGGANSYHSVTSGGAQSYSETQFFHQ